MSNELPFPNDSVPQQLSPELQGFLKALWKKVLNEPKQPDPEFVLVGRLNAEGSVLIKLGGGDEAHCRSEMTFLQERDPDVWTDYAVVTFADYESHVR